MRTSSSMPHPARGLPAMKESAGVRQIPGEPERRWFSSEDFDLIIWISADHTFTGFELCYDKRGRERSVVWSQTRGFSHMAVDDGERRPGRHKATPMLVADGAFDARQVYLSFLEASRSLPQEVTDFVLHTLEQYPDNSPSR